MHTISALTPPCRAGLVTLHPALALLSCSAHFGCVTSHRCHIRLLRDTLQLDSCYPSEARHLPSTFLLVTNSLCLSSRRYVEKRVPIAPPPLPSTRTHAHTPSLSLSISTSSHPLHTPVVVFIQRPPVMLACSSPNRGSLVMTLPAPLYAS